MVRLGDVTFDDWQSIRVQEGYTDTFILRLPPDNGLPPADAARAIRERLSGARRLRASLSLWVQVQGDGDWYRSELARALRGKLAVPFTVSPGAPRTIDFSFMPWVDDAPTLRPPQREVEVVTGIKYLRVLSRLGSASLIEIASQCGDSIPKARRIMNTLQNGKYVRFIPGNFVSGSSSRQNLSPWFLRHVGAGGESDCQKTDESPKKNSPYSLWIIEKAGISAALRSWGIPPGAKFPYRLERRRHTGARHRRAARLWQAWLEQAYGKYIDIWASWSEITLPGVRANPDGFAWGEYGGEEILFWLEVESGHASRKDVVADTRRRAALAAEYADEFGLRVIFGVIGMRWASGAARMAFDGAIPGNIAVVTAGWGNFGHLPIPEWGRVR